MRPIQLVLSITFLVVIVGAAFADDSKPNAGEKFDRTGKLSTGVVATGGETTGVILTTDMGVFELSISGDLVKKADKLDGKTVHVIGTLNLVAGVEIKQRKIVTVESLVQVAPD